MAAAPVTSPAIILGGGGHASVVIDCLRLMKVAIIGITDPGLPAGSDHRDGVPVLGGDEVLRDYPPSEVRLVNGIGSTGDTGPRRAVFERMTAQGYDFLGVVHPDAVVSDSAAVAPSAQIMARAVVQPHARIAANSIINTGAMVDHDCEIGEHVHIAPGVVLSGGVLVGDGAHIGTGAHIKQGVRIGEKAVVGAGITVLADVPAAEILHPAKQPVWTGGVE